MKKLALSLSLLAVTAFSAPSFAADDDQAATNSAQMEVRISTLEEEIRALHGQLEESQFQNKKLADTLDRFQKDIDLRFQQAQQQPAAPAGEPAPVGAMPPASQLNTPPADEARKPLAGSQVAVRDTATGASTVKNLATETAKPAATPATPPAKPAAPAADSKPAAAAAPAAAAPEQFTNARDHYNYAFRMLNQTKYDEAAASFKSFLKKYPKDPLAGNASYWLGETFYIRHDYVSAADNFRQGFESSPNGPKAADNLLKLAMSLDALKHDKEACTVLAQVVGKFGKSSANISHKAETEQKRIGCQ